MLLKYEPRLSRKGDPIDTRRGEDTSLVIVKVNGKSTGCGSLPFINFPKLAYMGSARGHSRQWDGYSVTLVGYAHLILAAPGQ